MSEIDEIVASLRPAEQRAVALVAMMIRIHGGREGQGLFVGAKRYAALVGRLRLSAERVRDVRSCWDLVATTMLWTIGPSKYDEAVLDLIASRDSDAAVLDVLASRTSSIVMIARQVVRGERDVAPEPRDAGTASPDAGAVLDDSLEDI